MATLSAIAGLPSFFSHGGETHSRKFPAHVAATHFGSLPNLSVPPPGAENRVVPGKRRVQIIAKAVGEVSDSTSIVKFVKDAWNEPGDRIAVVGLGFAGIVALRSTFYLVGAVDKLPLIPSVFEFVGILYSWWFIYRYLLFKRDRAELVDKIKKSVSDVLEK